MRNQFLTTAVVIVAAIATACGGNQTAQVDNTDSSQSSAVTAPAAVPDDFDAPLPIDPKVKKGVLPNGLTYLIRANKGTENRAEFRLIVNAGSLNETDSQQGYAHFVEHMAFNGTTSFPKNELISALQKLGVSFGAHVNAYTKFDETGYVLAVPTDKPATIELTLKVLAEWASEVTFTDADVDGEKGVVLAEKRSRDSAEARMMISIIKQALDQTRYAKRLPIGQPAHIKKATPAALRKFYTDWYHPENMAVIAVGDFDVTDIENKIRSQFGGLTKNPSPPTQPDRVIPAQTGPKFVEIQDKELPVSAVVVGRLWDNRSITANDWKRGVTDLVALMTVSKRLEERGKKGKARYLIAQGAPIPLVRNSWGLGLLAATRPNQMKEGLEDVLEEIERARRHGLTAPEVERTKKTVMALLKSQAKEAAADKQAHSEVVDELERHFLAGDIPTDSHVMIAVLDKIIADMTLDKLNGAVKAMFVDDSLIIASAVPKGGTGLDRATALAALSRAKSKSLVGHSEDKSNTPLMSSAPTRGKIVSEKKLADIGATEWVLSNGAHVIVKPTTFKSDEVMLAARSAGGESVLPSSKLASIWYAAQIVKRGGLGELDSVALERALAGRNVSVSPFINGLSEGISANSSVEDLEVMMQLVHMTFEQPRKDADAFKVWKESKLQEVKLGANSPRTKFQRKMQNAWNNGNPRMLEPNEALVNSATLDAAYNYYRDRFSNAGDFTFIIVGNIDVDKLRPLVATYIGSLSDNKRRERIKLDKWPAPKKSASVVVKSGSTPKSMVYGVFKRSVKPTTVKTKDALALQLFGDTLALRMIDVFREGMAKTYSPGAASWVDGARDSAKLLAGFACDPADADALTKSLIAEVTKALRGGLGKDNFEKAKAAAIEKYKTKLQSNGYWLRQINDERFFGRPLAGITKRVAVIERLSLADANAAAKRFVDVRKPITAVLLPE